MLKVLLTLNHTLRLVSPSKLAVVIWQTQSSVAQYNNNKSHGKALFDLTSTISPHYKI